MNVVCRARPLLGTLVEMRVEGLADAQALAAIEAAFVEVATIHRLMSFHERDSDLSRLHRAPLGTPVDVDARTHRVLHTAIRIAERSQGLFDPTVAARQVARGRLPVPASAFTPEPGVDWRAIELLDGNRVRLRCGAWIDLGGIAKGYAVDRAIEILTAAGAVQVCVNAGGDLRVHGERAEPVFMKTRCGIPASPMLELRNAAIATSSASDHIGGARRATIGDDATVSVLADECVVADALTKIASSGDPRTADILCEFDAEARCWQDDVAGAA